MNRRVVKSYGKFRRRVIRNLRLHQSAFDRDMQELAIRAKALRGEGPYASRAIAAVAQGEQFPVRYIGKRMAECVEADVGVEIVREFGNIVAMHGERLLWASYGWDDPADVEALALKLEMAA